MSILFRYMRHDKRGEAESFFYDFRQTLKKVNKKDITAIMCNFNAKLGKESRNEFVGPHGIRVYETRAVKC